MRVLWVGTKFPWPPGDGGRLLALLTIRALAALGHEVTLVAPAGTEASHPAGERALQGIRTEPVPHRPLGILSAWLRGWATGLPVTIVRHTVPAVEAVVARHLATQRFDVVHAEQLQALAQCAPARAHGVPVVLRAQNVESDLWAALAARGGFRGRLARGEARRLASFEGRAVAGVTAAVALTGRDAARLAALAGGRTPPVAISAAPFPAELEASSPLAGRPAVAVLAGGWLPNRDASRWFTRDAWPLVLRTSPDAVLHLFGAPRNPRWCHHPSIRTHPAPEDSARAFPAGAIVAVPLRVASGVRVKILEAWARGLPVVATPEAVAGLDARDGEELLLASNPRDLALALARLAGDPALAARLVAGGRRCLRRCHDPERVTRQLADVYGSVGSAAADGAPGHRPRPAPPGRP